MSARRRTVLAAATAALVLLLAIPAAAQAYWGAIAIDPVTGNVGFAHRQPNANKAQTVARKDCGTPHCKAAVWVSNGYGAVVLKHNGVFVAGIGRTKNLAFTNARIRAHEQSARKIAWVFSGYS
ncbi:MAG TPA: DUF4189 domain-containing protein [Solirubrobacterales bacterium]